MPRTPPYPTNSDIPQTPTSLEKKILDPHMNSHLHVELIIDIFRNVTTIRDNFVKYILYHSVCVLIWIVIVIINRFKISNILILMNRK